MISYKSYINLIRNILMTFDKEFDHMIITILLKIFDDYYMNRNDKIYCIDNLYKKYDLHRYELLKKKYNVSQNNKLIFRFRKYNKKEYIINLWKKSKNLILEDDETHKSIANEILKSDIDCYTKYINDFCSNRFLTKKRNLLFVFILHALIKL